MKTALICSVSGQDGAYLAQLLLSKGYGVCGTSRDAQMSTFKNLALLGIREQVKLESVALNDFRSVLQVISKIQRDEVYNLAGQTSVGLSFGQPVETDLNIDWRANVVSPLQDFISAISNADIVSAMVQDRQKREESLTTQQISAV